MPLAQPLISIITPVYNTAPLLPRCIDSVLGQTYQNWELLLVNDGSTDNSLEICQRYAEQDSRIRVFTQDNQGQSVARNLALDHAKGDLIAFLDSDDAVMLDTYQGVVDTFVDNPGCDVIVIPVWWINSNEQFCSPPPKDLVAYGEDARWGIIQERYPFILCNKIYPIKLLDGLRFVPGMLFEDNLFGFEAAKRINLVCYSVNGGYEYHQEDFDPDKNKWTPYKDRSLLTVYLRVISLYDGESYFDRKVRREIYRRLINYTYPRFLKYTIAPELLAVRKCFASLTWHDLFKPPQTLRFSVLVKLLVAKICSSLLLLGSKH